MQILITGGSGYIGSVLVPLLLDKGHSVTVVDNLFYNQTTLLHLLDNKNLTFIKGDCRDEDVIKEQMKTADAILPLACLVGAPLCKQDPVGAQTINFDAAHYIVKNASKNQKVIFPNTNSGYGIGQEGMNHTEESPLNPISIYGRLKVDLENRILDSGNGISFRFATVFGVSPRMRLDLLVNDFTYRAVHDRSVVLFESHFKRNFLHVKDAAKAFMHTLDNYDSMNNEAYNVGLSNANLSKLELCEVIKSIAGDFEIICSEISEDPDKRNYIVSNDKIEATGFKTDVSLEDGIKGLVKAFNAMPRSPFGNM
jgi:nucleoside-diphosphate-sugar epimerase